MPAPFTLASFQKQYRALLAQFGRGLPNSECVECVGCKGCQKCTFCKTSQQLIGCHYCEKCEDCIESLHCSNSRGLNSCQHCDHSERCHQSSYLVLCVSLSRCNYCYGCVGLANLDYHILNQRYERKDYFRVLETLPSGLTAFASKLPLKRAKKAPAKSA